MNVTIVDSSRPWQVGDLVRVANRPEPRLIVAIEDAHIIVIAESGWYNRYQIPSDLPITFDRSTGLVYTYKGRETLYSDFLKGVFTSYFTIN